MHQLQLQSPGIKLERALAAVGRGVGRGVSKGFRKPPSEKAHKKITEKNYNYFSLPEFVVGFGLIIVGYT